MDVFEAITTRASATALTEPGPSDAQIAALLQAGACAPDHGRLRPWRFLVVRGKAREELGDLMAAARERDNPTRHKMRWSAKGASHCGRR